MFWLLYFMRLISMSISLFKNMVESKSRAAEAQLVYSPSVQIIENFVSKFHSFVVCAFSRLICDYSYVTVVMAGIRSIHFVCT